MPRTPLTATALVLVCACSSFVGSARVDPPRDAAAEAAPDVAAPADVAVDRPAAPVDAPPACGELLGPCDPVGDTGCPAGQSCRVVDVRTLTSRCGVAGAGLAGSECAREEDCGAGTHCLFRRCVRLCCAEGGDAVCAARFGARSRCGVLTNSVLIQGCTLRNQCDYVRQTGCPPGTGCYPTSDVGESVCLQRGTAAVGEPCSTANDCVAGATCASVSAARPGLCRPVCNPLEPVCPAGTSCRGFSERPGDWGYCDGR